MFVRPCLRTTRQMAVDQQWSTDYSLRTADLEPIITGPTPQIQKSVRHIFVFVFYVSLGLRQT